MAWWTDLRLAARTWRRTPSLAAVVIGTLALGIGATTAAFTLAYSILVQPLPFPQPERLVWVSSFDTRTSDGSGNEAGTNRLSQFIDWQHHAHSFELLGAWAGVGYDNFTITGSGTPERVNGVEVTQQVLPMFGASTVIGSLFRDGDDRVGIRLNGTDREIIAVIHDVKHRGLDVEPGQEFYLSYLQTPGWQTFDLVARSADPSALVPTIRAAIQRVDPEQAVGTPIPLQQLIDRTMKPRRLLSWLLGTFAATALVLAALGVYGIVGYRVARRTKENALRVALGATQRRIMSRVFADALATSVIGMLVGIPLSLVTGTVVRSYLFDVTPQDPTALIGGLTALLLITMIGACIPAWRAARVDVMTTLRMEG
jgi:hypothetical protein